MSVLALPSLSMFDSGGFLLAAVICECARIPRHPAFVGKEPFLYLFTNTDDCLSAYPKDGG